MELSFPKLFVVVNLMAVIALAAAPFIFFSAYAEESNNVWTIKIMKGSSDQNPSQTFSPNELPVLLGDKVVWENEDTITHSVTSGLPKYPEHSGFFFYPGEVKPGKSVSHVLTNNEFTAFLYFCEIHPWMTGKLFMADVPIAQPETIHPIGTDKKSYNSGDAIIVSGKVHEDFAGTDYQILIFDQKNNLVDSTFGYFNNDASYLETSQTNSINSKNSEYIVKLVYGLPSKVAQTSFEFSNTDLTQNEKTTIPDWIKNLGGFWCDDLIKDSEFVSALQYLIKENVIILNEKITVSGSSYYLPTWIKDNSCLWADNKISDSDFLAGLEYLINLGTIRV